MRAAATIEALRPLLGARLSTAPSVREQHGHDWTWHAGRSPDAVAFPESTEEVRAIVARCAQDRTPVVPFGAGTSVEGHVAAVRGGVCVDLSRMDAILAVHAEDMDAHVQAGVTRLALNKALKHTGLFFPIDPGADASLGGMCATRASGTNAVRYGTMRDNVLSLTVVTPDARVIRTARRARKSAAGYDLTRLFIGSEGTLGIITEVTVQLYGVPEAVTSAICSFDDLADAVHAVIELIQSGTPVARVELLDEVLLGAVNRYAGLAYDVAPTLLIELAGAPAAVTEAAEAAARIARDHRCRSFRWSADEGERERMWRARRDVPWASMALRPGSKMLATDVCVPISRLAECIVQTKADLAESGLLATLVGHVGDGNFHLGLLIDPSDAEEVRRAQRFSDRLARRALDMDGTCTGEHGVGLGKRHLMGPEHGEALEVMRALKRALDPHDIMNPGKLLPDPVGG